MTMVIAAAPDGSLHELETAKLSDEAYRRAVLRSPEVSEDDADALLQQEARHLGVQIGLRPDFLAGSISSASSTTVGIQEEQDGRRYPPISRPTTHASESFHSQSLPPTPVQWRRSASTPVPNIPQRRSSLLQSLSRMATLGRKRTDKSKLASTIIPESQPINRMTKRSSESCFSAQARIDSWTPVNPSIERVADRSPSRPQTSASVRPQTAHNVRSISSKDGLESCFSAQSKLSSWSVSPTLTPSLVQDPVELELPDVPELDQLRAQQVAERERFLEYQRTSLRNLRLGMEQSKKGRQDANAILMEERKAKHETALATLESRQLEAELKLMNELEIDNRTCHIRLRHMEAYCHSPSRGFSPPHTPLSASDRNSMDHALPYPPELRTPPSPRRSLTVIDTSSSFLSDSSSSSSSSSDSTTPTDPAPSVRTTISNSNTHISALPQPLPPLLPRILTRTVTDKDFTLLARQYRLRDTLSTRHRSRIAVLRGRQEKAVEALQALQAAEERELQHKLDAQILTLVAEWEERRAQAEKDLHARAGRLRWRWELESRVCVARRNRPPTTIESGTDSANTSVSDLRVDSPRPPFEADRATPPPTSTPPPPPTAPPILSPSAPNPGPSLLLPPPPVPSSAATTTNAKYATAPSSPAGTPRLSPSPSPGPSPGPAVEEGGGASGGARGGARSNLERAENEKGPRVEGDEWVTL